MRDNSDSRPRVGLFVTCLVDLIRPSVGFSAVKLLEDALDKVRKGEMPRTVNFITGPSRIADIEQTIFMGAHGPRRMHIVLVEDE